MQSDYNALRLKSVDLHIEAIDQKKDLTIDGVTVSQREARPGDTIAYQVPIGAEPGPLYFTVADAGTTNITDFHQAVGGTTHSSTQLIATVNDLHPNTRAYIRVWRADPAFQLEGVDIPSPPASVSLVLSGWQTSLAGVSQTRNSKVAQMEFDAGDVVISGVKTVQVDIKE